MNPYHKIFTQFKHLSEHVNSLIAKGAFSQLEERTQRSLLGKLKALYQKLISVFSAFRLQRILGGAAILLGLGLSHYTKAQTFGAIQKNPFGFAPSTEMIAPAFADIDNDGDLDMFSGEYSNGQWAFYENTGTAQSPAFGTPQTNPFGLTPADTYNFPAAADMDDDGDTDLLSMDFYGRLVYYENTGSISAPAFGAPDSVHVFGFTPDWYYFMPALADLDDDGDLDLLAGGIGYFGNIQFHENTGSKSNPNFSTVAVNPFNISLPPSTFFHAPSFADLDNDGDLDLLLVAMEYSGGITTMNAYYYENIGTKANPDFGGTPQVNPFGISPSQDSYYTPNQFVDLDADGDMDLVVGSYEYYNAPNVGNVYYFENTSPVGLNTPAEVTFKLYPNPATEHVQISLPNDLTLIGSLFELINGMGQTVYQQVLSDQHVTLNVADIPAGVYYIQVDRGSHRMKQPIVIE